MTVTVHTSGTAERPHHRGAGRRRAVAIPMVVVFLSIVAVVAVATSYQTSFIRKGTARSYFGFEAVEICDSAINEAAGQVNLTDVFPTSDFPDMRAFFIALSNDDQAALNAGWGGKGYQFQFRNVRKSATDPSPPRKADGSPTNGRLFTCMLWPTGKRPTSANNYGGSLKTYDVPQTRAMAQGLFGFKSLSQVKMSVLAWRRDFAGKFWQDWGVLHFEVTAEFDDGRNKATRTIETDRMFSLFVHSLATGKDHPTEPDPPADENNPTPQEVLNGKMIFYHYIQSRSNLRTVITRS